MGEVFGYAGWSGVSQQSSAAADDGDAVSAQADRRRSVAELGERHLVGMFANLARGDSTADAGAVILGSGDDAAVVDAAGPTVISVDTCVQDKHFRPAWSTPRQVGERAVIQSVADIAAMGGRPIGVVAALICPPELPAGALMDLNTGIAAAAERVGARILGGDLVEGREVVVSVTAVGVLDGDAPVALSAARPGDVLAVSGELGASAAGLALLLAADEQGSTAHQRWPQAIAAFQVPNPDLAAGPRAARAGVHAMTDISDGLVEELITLAQAAGVQVSVSTADLPLPDDLVDIAADLGHPDSAAVARRWAVTGGEDHELLGAFAVGQLPDGWTAIGSVGEGPAAVVVDAKAVPLADRSGAREHSLHGWRTFD